MYLSNSKTVIDVKRIWNKNVEINSFFLQKTSLIYYKTDSTVDKVDKQYAYN